MWIEEIWDTTGDSVMAYITEGHLSRDQQFEMFGKVVSWGGESGEAPEDIDRLLPPRHAWIATRTSDKDPDFPELFFEVSPTDDDARPYTLIAVDGEWKVPEAAPSPFEYHPRPDTVMGRISATLNTYQNDRQDGVTALACWFEAQDVQALYRVAKAGQALEDHRRSRPEPRYPQWVARHAALTLALAAALADLERSGS